MALPPDPEENGRLSGLPGLVGMGLGDATLFTRGSGRRSAPELVVRVCAETRKKEGLLTPLHQAP